MKRNIYAIAALAAVCLVAYHVAGEKFITVDLVQLKSGEIGVLFLTAIFSALVIERAVEVYINNRYDVQEAPFKRGLRIASLRVINIEAAIDREITRNPLAAEPAATPAPIIPDGATPEEIAAAQTAAAAAAEAAITPLSKLRAEAQGARAQLLIEKQTSAETLDDISVRKAAEAGLIAVILSLCVAAAGVRIFGQFLTVDVAKDIQAVPGQWAWFQFVDVVLTALLLAGGADGVHQLVRDFLKKREDIIPLPATG